MGSGIMGWIGRISVIVVGAIAVLAGEDTPLPEGWPRSTGPGTVRLAGTDLASDLVQALDDRLRRHQPDLRTVADLHGASRGISALSAGTVDAVLLLRRPTDREIADLTRAWDGVAPVVQPAARLALEIRVHPTNPVARRGLTVAELDAIFGGERRRGSPTAVTTWGQVGGTDGWATRPVAAYCSHSASHLSGQIRIRVLEEGPLAVTVREQPSGPVLMRVAEDPSGIAIVWQRGAAEGGTLRVPVVDQAHGAPMDPDPLAGTLWVVLRPSELGAPPAALRAWLDLLWSRPGQELVTLVQALPLDGPSARAARWASRVDMIGQVDPTLPRYAPGPELPGQLRSMGSDTLNNLMTVWAEAFDRHHPGARVEVEGKGGGTAFGAMVGDHRHFGPAARPFSEEQIEQIRSRHGSSPRALRVAQDLMAVIVHPDNPIAPAGMTLAQLDAAFGAEGRRGAGVAVTWGDLGLSGTWAASPIRRVGRNSASGTYGWFLESVLQRGSFHRDLSERPGSTAVVRSVAEDPMAIGFCGIGYAMDPAVRIVPLAAATGRPFVVPDPAMPDPMVYPLHRYLLLHVHPKPDPAAWPAMAAFLRLIASREGQLAVLQDGYMPMPWAILREDLAALGVTP